MLGFPPLDKSGNLVEYCWCDYNSICERYTVIILLTCRKRKDKHKENEAIQFDFDMDSDAPENVAQEMVS